MNPQFDSPRKSTTSLQDRINEEKLSRLIHHTMKQQKNDDDGCSHRTGRNSVATNGRSIFDRQYPVRRAQAPVAPMVLQNLPTVVVAAPHDCAICKDRVPEKTTAVRLPCGHLYHPACITQWLQEHASCPMCRCSLPTLCHFTTPRAQLPAAPVHETLRPPLVRRADLLAETPAALQSMYRSWVICTYQHRPLPLAIPSEVASDNREALMDYLAECRVIQLLPEV